MAADDGKTYATDVADTEQLLRLIQSIWFRSANYVWGSSQSYKVFKNLIGFNHEAVAERCFAKEVI